MASIPCTTHLPFTSKPLNSPSYPTKFSSQFLGIQSKVGWIRPCRIGPSNGSRAKCWFKFGKSGVDAEGAGIYGSQSRDDFDRDDVEQVLFLSSLHTYIFVRVTWVYLLGVVLELWFGC